MTKGGVRSCESSVCAHASYTLTTVHPCTCPNGTTKPGGKGVLEGRGRVIVTPTRAADETHSLLRTASYDAVKWGECNFPGAQGPNGGATNYCIGNGRSGGPDAPKRPPSQACQPHGQPACSHFHRPQLGEHCARPSRSPNDHSHPATLQPTPPRSPTI
jgi:hypothetical protein